MKLAKEGSVESRIRQIMAHIAFVREGLLFKPTPLNKINAEKLEDARVELKKIADELRAGEGS